MSCIAADPRRLPAKPVDPVAGGVYKRDVPSFRVKAAPVLQDFLARMQFTLVSLVVSTFPERAKRDGWPAHYASAAAHAFSGWVEVLISVGLFGVGFLGYVGRFVEGPGWTYVSRQPTLTYGDFFGMGALGYVSYLFTPISLVTLYCIAEGLVRGLDSAFSDRMVGVAFVAVPWRIVGRVRRLSARRRLAELLGPERPDQVVTGEAGSGSALVIFSAREKPWSERQVLEYQDDFYAVAGRRLVPHGPHHAYRYDLRRLEPAEVIRGALLRYAPGGPAVVATSEAGAVAPVRPHEPDGARLEGTPVGEPGRGRSPGPER